MKQLILKFIYYVLATSARRVIRRFDPFVIAVTGSVGKTSAKEAIFVVLDSEMPGKVRKNHGNLNAEIGLPLTILGFDMVPSKFGWGLVLIQAILRSFRTDVYPKYLILEMGVEHPGDINYLTGIAKPDMVIITSLSGAHLQYFDSKEHYIKEKLTIIDRAEDGARIIINADDPILSKIDGDNLVRIGITGGALDYKAEEIRLSLTDTEYRITGTGHKIAVKTEVLGQQLIYSQLIAFAAADSLKLSLVKIGKALGSITRVSGRMRPLAGIKGTTIIDDTYNAASPVAVMAALDFLAKVNYSGRRVAILGTMNELGKDSEKIHSEIGHYALGKCDLAIFVGKNASIMARGHGESKSSLQYQNRDEAINSLDSVIKPDDLILVKASQGGNYFEEIVKSLMKDKDQSSRLLVRQSREWMRRKAR